MDEDDYYRPTEDEAEAINRAGFLAAWDVLSPAEYERPVQELVLAMLRAFSAARSATKKEWHLLRQANPGKKYVAHYPDHELIVCSAIYAIDAGSSIGLAPISIGGARLVALIKCARALEAMSCIEAAFEDDESVFGTHLADETIRLAEAAINGRVQPAS